MVLEQQVFSPGPEYGLDSQPKGQGKENHAKHSAHNSGCFWRPRARRGAGAAARADAPSYFYPPKFKVQIKPNYPDSARAKHETGVVFVKVLIGARRVGRTISIAKSSGHKDLDDEVLGWRKLSSYSPATRNGQADRPRFMTSATVHALTGLVREHRPEAI